MNHSVAVSENEAQAPENLVLWMVNLLAEHGHPNPESWKQHLAAGIDSLPDPDYQMYEINRAWRVAFSNLVGKDILTPVESMDVRYAIIDKCPVDSWKTAFIQGALPCIIRLKLPLTV